MKPILEAIDVRKAYGAHVALDGVSLSIPEGSIFGLLGPNGAGKTSLIRIITQITGADSGEIRFRGERLNPSHIADIGYLPEERGLYKKMKVGEQLLYLARLRGLSRAEATQRIRRWLGNRCRRETLRQPGHVTQCPLTGRATGNMAGYRRRVSGIHLAIVIGGNFDFARTHKSLL